MGRGSSDPGRLPAQNYHNFTNREFHSVQSAHGDHRKSNRHVPLATDGAGSYLVSYNYRTMLPAGSRSPGGIYVELLHSSRSRMPAMMSEAPSPDLVVDLVLREVVA